MGMIRSEGVLKIKAALDRALDRNPWWKKHLAESAKAAEKATIQVGDAVAEGHRLRVEGDLGLALEETIKRITKGLLFDQNPDFDTSVLNLQLLQANEENPEGFLEILKELGKLPYRKILGDRVFLAAWGYARDKDDTGVMIISIYDGLNFVVFFSPDGVGNS